MAIGKIHSIETFGAVDGPGIRTVFFMQGCPARCLYCHNPDSWNIDEYKEEMTAQDIVHWALRGKPYYETRAVGVKFSGGDPLMPGEFLIEAIKALREEGIESIIDPSGTYLDQFSEEAINQADMLLLDIKHPDMERFKAVAGVAQDTLFETIDLINKLDKPIWIRNVVVPDINDTEEDIHLLNTFIKEHFKSGLVRKIELLGYHTMAVNKYGKLGITYRLKGVPPMDGNKLEKLKELLIRPEDI